MTDTMLPVDIDRLALIIGRGVIQQTALEQQLDAAVQRIQELEGGGGDADKSRGSGNKDGS